MACKNPSAAAVHVPAGRRSISFTKLFTKTYDCFACGPVRNGTVRTLYRDLQDSICTANPSSCYGPQSVWKLYLRHSLAGYSFSRPGGPQWCCCAPPVLACWVSRIVVSAQDQGCNHRVNTPDRPCTQRFRAIMAGGCENLILSFPLINCQHRASCPHLVRTLCQFVPGSSELSKGRSTWMAALLHAMHRQICCRAPPGVDHIRLVGSAFWTLSQAL